jgi:hypothetical protein
MEFDGEMCRVTIQVKFLDGKAILKSYISLLKTTILAKTKNGT